MEVQICNTEAESEPMDGESPVRFDELNLREVIDSGSLEFDEWTTLISEIEKTYPDDIEKLCLVYDSFLSEFPLCYGYWRKYADHRTRLCTVDKVVEVFEQAVQSATYSVGVWADYCSFSMSVFEDPFDIRRLFMRGLSFVGKDYLCHTLWDKYIEFEFSQQQWSSLAHIYIQTLRFPTKKLHRFYESFKKLMAIREEMETSELLSETVLDSEVPTCYKDDEISLVIKDLLGQSVGLTTSKALQKYLYIGQQFYQEACQLDEKIHCFETHIRRSYFHVKPLDVTQLENWHHYLDFVEMQGDFDWAVKLYERCLIPCANYPEFWMRYVEFMEKKGGREISNLALDRATQIFLKRVPMIHIFNARFKEKIGDVFGARAAFLQCDTESDSSFVEYVIIRANMEKRLGKFDAASDVYKEALEMAAAKQKLHALPILYVHFSRLKYMITDSVDAARDVLIDGIKHMPYCSLLLEELIKFIMMHGGPMHINVVDSIIANAISPSPEGLSPKDGEDISRLYLEFIDLCGTIHDVRKAWDRHIKLFPHFMRTTSSYKHPARGTKTFNMAMEGRTDALVAVPYQPSGDCCSDFQIQLPVQDDKLSLPENHDTQSNQASAEEVSEQKLLSQENHCIQSDQAVTDQLPSGEANNSAEEIMQQLSPKVSEQPEEDAPEPNVPSFDLGHQVSNEIESIQSSQDCSKESEVQPQYDQEPEQDLKPPSLESLSLISQENESLDSIPTTSHECEGPQETCMSNGSMLESGHNTNGDPSISSPICTQAADSAPIQVDMVSPSSSASHQTPTFTQPLSQLQGPAKSGGNWHQMTNTDKVRRDFSSRFRGHSHKRRHQQRQVSPQQNLQTEKGPKMPMIQSYPLSLQNQQVQQGSQAQNQYQAAADTNLTAAHAMPMQNVQQQNFASACQSQLPGQLGAYPQAHMSQYPMQSHEQYGQMQSSQAYNQMWQYYYFQQHQHQQFLLQQQQQLQLQLQQLQLQQPQQQQQQQQHQQQQLQLQLQLQQNYLQQQQLQQLQQQPYQQQQQQHNQMQQLQLQLQQQFLQQQQQHSQQQQSQLQQLQQQQSLQQQPYQQQQLQQQQLQQQQLLYLQQQQLQLQQLTQQQLQPLQQQQQHQHQQVLQQQQQQQQQKQQQEQQPPQQQQQELEEQQRQHEQQTTSSQIQPSNNNHNQKGQGVTPPRGSGASGSNVSAVSPHSEEQSP